MQNRALLAALHAVCRRPQAPVTLSALARRAARSRFNFHRAFRRAAGETPKAYTQRLRLQLAAALLLSTAATVGQIASACGFASHEVFTRAFRRNFHCAPLRYRHSALGAAPSRLRAAHVAFDTAIAPCIRLFHLRLADTARRSDMPTLSITREERAAQPILLIRRRILRSELQSMLAECFGKLYAHGQKERLLIAGWPLARYVSMGPGRWTVEAAMPLAAPAEACGEMQPGTLHGGAVALAIHAGPYEQLPETNAAIEQWIEARGLRIGGAPWESYVTDPAQHPDPADWRTEVYWPLAE